MITQRTKVQHATDAMPDKINLECHTTIALLIKEGWELHDVMPFTRTLYDRPLPVWDVILFKGGIGMHIELAHYSWTACGLEYQCPECGHKTGEDFCYACHQHIEPVMIKNIPESFKRYTEGVIQHDTNNCK